MMLFWEVGFFVCIIIVCLVFFVGERPGVYRFLRDFHLLSFRSNVVHIIIGQFMDAVRLVAVCVVSVLCVAH